MKKCFFTLLLICLCTLCSCNDKSPLSGQVLELHVTDTSTGLVLLTAAEEEIGLVIDESTTIMSHFDDIDANALKTGVIKDVMITAQPGGKTSSITTAEGKALNTRIAEHILITGVLTDSSYRLSDGTKLALWRYTDSTLYQLANGNCLLQVKNPMGPANSYTAGLESLDDLSATVKEAILSYYDTRGNYYDIDTELERAYKEYQTTKNKKDFQSHLLEQSISPASSNEKMICFLTSVTLPLSGNNVYEMRFGTVFDKETGEKIDNRDLFSCSEVEAKDAILNISEITEPVLREEMSTAFSPEYILLLPNCLEVTIPAGTLPSHEDTYILALERL